MKLSKLAEQIQTSPILILAAEINEKIQRGETFYNLTVGDFDSKIFPIPQELKKGIMRAYADDQTNYPGPVGTPNLRAAVSQFLAHYGNLDYSADTILVSSGARPILYSAYRTIVDPGDKVLFPVPSWNNDYYTCLNHAQPLIIETKPEHYFMPTADTLKPHLKETSLIVLCSPLNPTGTVFNQSALETVCDLVLEENATRGKNEKPLYILFDQIYWMLTFGKAQHHHPVSLRPALRDYAVFVDGISKGFAATGVRLGWGFGPKAIMSKMTSVVAHMGAWAPKAEQIAAGDYLANTEAVDRYLATFRKAIHDRLEGFYQGFMALKKKGYAVDAIEPQAAIYLTVQFNLQGATTAEGKKLDSPQAVHRYLLNEARVGFVPFSYFGASESPSWYRLSVGTCRLEEVATIMDSLERALSKLS